MNNNPNNFDHRHTILWIAITVIVIADQESIKFVFLCLFVYWVFIELHKLFGGE